MRFFFEEIRLYHFLSYMTLEVHKKTKKVSTRVLEKNWQKSLYFDIPSNKRLLMKYSKRTFKTLFSSSLGSFGRISELFGKKLGYFVLSSNLKISLTLCVSLALKITNATTINFNWTYAKFSDTYSTKETFDDIPKSVAVTFSHNTIALTKHPSMIILKWA